MTGDHQRITKGCLGAFRKGYRLIVLHIVIAGRLAHVAQPVAHIIGAGEGQHILLIITVDPGLKTRRRILQTGRINADPQQSIGTQPIEPLDALTAGAVNVFSQ
ncbi:hypothetical protein D3C80_921800 [compost metagenome]